MKNSQGGPASAWVSWGVPPGLSWGRRRKPEGTAAVVKARERASRAEMLGTGLGQAQGRPGSRDTFSITVASPERCGCRGKAGECFWVGQSSGWASEPRLRCGGKWREGR